MRISTEVFPLKMPFCVDAALQKENCSHSQSTLFRVPSLELGIGGKQSTLVHQLVMVSLNEQNTMFAAHDFQLE